MVKSSSGTGPKFGSTSLKLHSKCLSWRHIVITMPRNLLDILNGL